jgi:nucleotide-binding universal stress UspA family protein
MTAQTKSRERFVVVAAVAGVDGDDSSQFVVESAARIAGSTSGGELHLVHVLENFEPPPLTEIPNPWRGGEALELGRQYLQRVGKMAETVFPGRAVGHLATGQPWREIVQFAERLAADLVVVGTHSRKGIRRLALGSVSEQVVRMSKCPVLVARHKSYAASDVPEIEPACADCLKRQAETSGQALWCTRHATHHPVAHVHYEFPQSFALGSELLAI